MITVERFVFNSFQVNTFILFDDTRDCIIIDPANYAEEENRELESFINKHDLHPVFQMNTHCHIDHILGIQWVKDSFKIPFYAHEKEVPLLNNAPLMGELYGFNISQLPSMDEYIIDNQIVRFGNSEIHALHVPGHSEGSLAYYIPETDLVITGDALFAGSIGRTDLPGGDYDTLIQAIREKLFSLPENTVVWPGHGPSSTISEEINNNPFFSDYKT